jgi:hypothetical protein
MVGGLWVDVRIGEAVLTPVWQANMKINKIMSNDLFGNTMPINPR